MAGAKKKQLAPNLQVDSEAEQPRIGDEMGEQHGPEAPAGRCDATPADLGSGLKFCGCSMGHLGLCHALTGDRAANSRESDLPLCTPRLVDCAGD